MSEEEHSKYVVKGTEGVISSELHIRIFNFRVVFTQYASVLLSSHNTLVYS